MMARKMRATSGGSHGRARYANEHPTGLCSRSFPAPYLSFPADRIDEVCRLALRIQPHREIVICKRCGRRVSAAAVVNRTLSPLSQTSAQWTSTVECPACRQVTSWFVGETAASSWSARPLHGFCDQFSRAVAEGIPLYTTAPMAYLGSVQWGNAECGAPVAPTGLMGHRFRIQGTGRERIVYLSKASRILAVIGQLLAGGQLWAHALSVPPPRQPHRCADLVAAGGGEASLSYLEWLWLRHQVIEHPDRPKEMLLPAGLSCLATQHIAPIDLYWDLAPCEQYVNARMEAVLLPPLLVRDTFQTRITLPGEIDINIGVNRSAALSLCRSHS